MQVNVGGADRWIRIVVGLAALGAGYAYHSWWGLLGLIPLVTGLVRWCPLYGPLGISTAGDGKGA